ncbi:DUF3221 domain-containing protein [Domibacillus tundrae]|uniref:DUF3221 domain-containing protein n=1 Tax=Domibacillus tundrae TaxID=1587527 RepID=UPI000618308C|nr:DUF3221 domain-containing protein [Domibacillus tundrae]
MKKYLLISICLAIFFLLEACSNEKNTVSTTTDTQMLEQFQGYVVEKGTTDDGREKVLVVAGITPKYAVEASYEDVAKSENHDNIVWFVNDENFFKDIVKGERVNVWWDPEKPITAPSILTLGAEKVEVLIKLEESTSTNETRTEEGNPHTQAKDSDSKLTEKASVQERSQSKNGITIKTEKAQYPSLVENINVTLQNDSNKEYRTGPHIFLEKK